MTICINQDSFYSKLNKLGYGILFIVYGVCWFGVYNLFTGLIFGEFYGKGENVLALGILGFASILTLEIIKKSPIWIINNRLHLFSFCKKGSQSKDSESRKWMIY